MCQFDPNARPAIGNKPGPNVTGTMAPGAPWAICITPGPNQFLYSFGCISGPRLQAQPRRQGAGHTRRVRQATQTVRLDSRNRVPVGERDLRRRITELARAKAIVASRSQQRLQLSRSRKQRRSGLRAKLKTFHNLNFEPTRILRKVLMSRLALTFACGSYDRTEALRTVKLPLKGST